MQLNGVCKLVSECGNSSFIPLVFRSFLIKCYHRNIRLLKRDIHISSIIITQGFSKPCASLIIRTIFKKCRRMIVDLINRQYSRSILMLFQRCGNLNVSGVKVHTQRILIPVNDRHIGCSITDLDVLYVTSTRCIGPASGQRCRIKYSIVKSIEFNGCTNLCIVCFDTIDGRIMRRRANGNGLQRIALEGIQRAVSVRIRVIYRCFIGIDYMVGSQSCISNREAFQTGRVFNRRTERILYSLRTSKQRIPVCLVFRGLIKIDCCFAQDVVKHDIHCLEVRHCAGSDIDGTIPYDTVVVLRQGIIRLALFKGCNCCFNNDVCIARFNACYIAVTVGIIGRLALISYLVVTSAVKDLRGASVGTGKNLIGYIVSQSSTREVAFNLVDIVGCDRKNSAVGNISLTYLETNLRFIVCLEHIGSTNGPFIGAAIEYIDRKTIVRILTIIGKCISRFFTCGRNSMDAFQTHIVCRNGGLNQAIHFAVLCEECSNTISICCCFCKLLPCSQIGIPDNKRKACTGYRRQSRASIHIAVLCQLDVKAAFIVQVQRSLRACS